MPPQTVVETTAIQTRTPLCTAEYTESLWSLNVRGVVKYCFSCFQPQDEEATESRPAKLFISTHNRQSEECAQLIKSILAGTETLLILRHCVMTFGDICLN